MSSASADDHVFWLVLDILEKEHHVNWRVYIHSQLAELVFRFWPYDVVELVLWLVLGESIERKDAVPRSDLAAS
jgi:hypothetical protein